MEQQKCTVYRIDSWDDETWEQVVDAVQETVASFDSEEND